MEEKVKEIVQRYSGDKSYLVPILQDVQKEFNYLPKDALFSVSAHLSVPISRVYEVVTFYKAFSLKPKGRNQLSLCMGTACHVRGAELIARNVEDILTRRPTSNTPSRRSAVSGPAHWGRFSW
jgi:NADH-quinone oxidoreductase subunit E